MDLESLNKTPAEHRRQLLQDLQQWRDITLPNTMVTEIFEGVPLSVWCRANHVSYHVSQLNDRAWGKNCTATVTFNDISHLKLEPYPDEEL